MPVRVLERPTTLTLFLTLALSLVACTPATVTPGRDGGPTPGGVTGLPDDDVRTVRLPGDLAVNDPLIRTAWEAWLRMEIGRITGGVYTTEVLLDLVLPSGIRWTIAEYGPDDYALVVTADGTPTGLRVDPGGVGVAR